MVDKREIVESIDSYLGEKERDILKTIDKDTLKLFIQQRIKLETSYIVKGSRKLLEQFRAYYLAISNKGVTRLKYGSYMLTEYASQLSNSDMANDLVVDELLFLYAHKNDIDLGNSETWLAKTIVNSIANRNRKNYATIILSERNLPLIEPSGEAKVIDLTLYSKTRAVNNFKSKAIQTSFNSGLY